MTHKIETDDSEMRNQPIPYIWPKVVFFTALHIMAFHGLILCCTSAKFYTILFAILLYMLGTLGITAGSHRLWSHKSYKARWPLRLFLMICNTIAFEDTIVNWAWDHRVHHKWTETNADPYNAKRGFFFSHIGWLVAERHPENVEKSKQIDLSDLYADPVVAFQETYYMIIMPLLCFVLPTFIPWYYWGEKLRTSWYVCGVMRYILQGNSIWLVNSAAHMWGNKPYDKNLWAVESLSVTTLTGGEGWHNYHHAFPRDYRAAELGRYSPTFTTLFLNACAWLGLAYDMRTTDSEMVKARTQRTGDGTHPLWGNTTHPTKVTITN